MINILIAEDEENLLNLYKIRLDKKGYNVILANNGKQAIDLIYKGGIDLAILDVMLPIYSGFEVLETIRRLELDIPVIMATSMGQLNDKKEGFSLGADDYLVKPFDFDELLMRIEAIVRRYKINTESKIVIGDTTLDAETLEVYNKTEKVTLSKKEFQILFKLLSYPEKTFTKEQIFDEFFGIDSNADYDSVKVYISKIRKQIAVFENIDIDNIRGIGYRGIRNG
ncbi:MAG: response regulator transcription factor [Bacilli bacterium]|nr:response regulator transcription factor [Bacilli bacterium]